MFLRILHSSNWLIGSNRHLHVQLLYYPPPKRIKNGVLISSHHALEKHNLDLQHGLHIEGTVESIFQRSVTKTLEHGSLPSCLSNQYPASQPRLQRASPDSGRASFLHRSRPDSRCKGVPDSTMVNASQDLAAFMQLRTKFTSEQSSTFCIRPSVAYRFAVYFSKRSLSEANSWHLT